MFDRRLATHFDWWFAIVILGMAILGLLGIYSANSMATSAFRKRSEERRVGKECRSRWSPYH